ncbi:MAG: autotransporter outer membrane beta-barrel domain-containing protein [Pseudomonadota bacterium]
MRGGSNCGEAGHAAARRVVRPPAARSARALATLALAGVIAAAAGGMAASQSVSLEEQGSGTNGVKNFTYTRSVATEAFSDAILTVTLIGDFNDSDENAEIFLDGISFATVLDNTNSNDTGDLSGDQGQVCVAQTINLTIPEATLNPLIADGALTVKVRTSSTVSGAGACISGGIHISAAVSGALQYVSVDPSIALAKAAADRAASIAAKQAAEEAAAEARVEQAEDNAESITTSRTTLTMTNMPALAGRLAGKQARTITPPVTPPSRGGGGPGGATRGVTGGASGGGAFSATNSLAGFVAEQSGAQAAPAYARLLGAGDASSGRVSFSTDLDTILAAARSNFSEDGSGSDPGLAAEGVSIDFWLGATYSYFEATSDGLHTEGDLASAQLGVDGRLSDSLLIGVAAFGDLLSSEVENGSDTTGLGFLTGPYVVATLDPNLYVEALAAVGRAYNTIETPGQNDAEYESDRLLLTARISGDWTAGAWSFRPSSRISYYAEKREAFDDGTGGIAEGDTTILGELRFGPEVAYTYAFEDGSARPFVGLEGVWAFHSSAHTPETRAFGAETVSASVMVGLDGQLGRTSFRAGGRFDGVADENLDSLTGEITLRVPLN